MIEKCLWGIFILWHVAFVTTTLKRTASLSLVRRENLMHRDVGADGCGSDEVPGKR